MFHYILIAVIAVLLISLIYYFSVHTSDESRRSRAARALNQSAGVFDDAARAALVELDQIEDPTPEDYFRRGHIIQHHVLGGEVRGGRARGDEDQIRHIMDNYTQALRGLRGADGHNTPGATGGAGATLTPDFIVNQVGEFDHLLLNLEDVEMDGIMRDIARFHGGVETTTPVIRADTAAKRAEAAAAVAPTRSAAITTAFDSATVYTDDRQNVHDSKVNNDLREVLNRVRCPIDPSRAIAEAREFISDRYSVSAGRTKATNASRVLDIVASGQTIGTFGESEDAIFAYIWNRAKHPRNSGRAELIREAVATALADGVENGTPVCANGRTARVLNSLVTLDYDPAIAAHGAMTFEAYRNEIFTEIKDIVADAIDGAATSSDSSLRAVGAAFESAGDVDESALGALAKFKSDLRGAIDAAVDARAGVLTPAEIANIKAESYVYATVD
jgi:hypothetical protein